MEQNNPLNDIPNEQNRVPAEEMPVAEEQTVEEQPSEEGREEEQTEEEVQAKKRKRGSRGGQTGKESEEELTKVTAELSEMKDKYLRLYAEFDNYRKRTSKERLDLIKTASQDVLLAFLPVLDDFERAAKAAGALGEQLPEGMVLIYEKLFRVAEQQGLRAMESTGADFDSDSHEAITKIPAPTAELKGKVVDTVEKGYYLHDKIIRYAKVVVGE